MKTVFVTGSMGFLGTALCDALKKDHWIVVGLSRDWSRTRLSATHINLDAVAHGDVQDMTLLQRVIVKHKVDAVIHLAAQAQVSAASADPTSTIASNVFGTLAVLEACRQQKVGRVIVASTDKVYGEANDTYTENSPLLERTPYAASKICADVLAQTYQEHYGMSVAVTRCGNLYGPGHFNWSTLIPGTLRRIALGQKPVLRFGGRAVRDFLFVDDAVDAYARLLDSTEVGPFNFSGGEPVSAKWAVRELLRLNELPDDYMDVRDEGSGEILIQALNCDRATSLLGWHPDAPLKIGLDWTSVWYKNYFKENPPCA